MGSPEYNAILDEGDVMLNKLTRKQLDGQQAVEAINVYIGKLVDLRSRCEGLERHNLNVELLHWKGMLSLYGVDAFSEKYTASGK